MRIRDPDSESLRSIFRNEIASTIFAPSFSLSLTRSLPLVPSCSGEVQWADTPDLADHTLGLEKMIWGEKGAPRFR